MPGSFPPIKGAVPLRKEVLKEKENLPVIKRRKEEKESLPVIKRRKEEKESLPVIERREAEKESLPVIERREEKKESLPVIKRRKEEKESLPVIERREAEKDKIVADVKEKSPTSVNSLSSRGIRVNHSHKDSGSYSKNGTSVDSENNKPLKDGKIFPKSNKISPIASSKKDAKNYADKKMMEGATNWVDRIFEPEEESISNPPLSKKTEVNPYSYEVLGSSVLGNESKGTKALNSESSELSSLSDGSGAPQAAGALKAEASDQENSFGSSIFKTGVDDYYEDSFSSILGKEGDTVKINSKKGRSIAELQAILDEIPSAFPEKEESNGKGSNHSEKESFVESLDTERRSKGKDKNQR